MTDLEQLLQQAKKDIFAADNLRSLDDYRVHYLGKKGKLTEYLKNLGQLAPEERPAAGQKINQIKKGLQEALEQRASILQTKELEQQLQAEWIDVTLPGRRQSYGTIHPVIQTADCIEKIFTQMGFSVMEGPEIEDDYHNFTALNIPKLHPARAEQDTFYFADESLLRTQVSPVQIRAMETSSLPLRMIAIGRVYRRDFDLTHTPMFHQVEGLMVDENVSFADLKGILTQVIHRFFNKEVSIRFRASYFPFTEPSAEIDIGCVNCESKGCRICKESGWLEILGCGMVHPEVFQAVGIDSERYSGWAFGLGLERLTMLRYHITDLRSLFENDLRFLRQF
jgi:phenylalanyl-tRNA synthetase alpha chain